MKKSLKRVPGGLNFHSLDCKYCGETVTKCDINAVKITCYKCTFKLTEGKRLVERN